MKNKLIQLSTWIAAHITFVVVLVTAVALFLPSSFAWIDTSAITPMLGVVMFGMGLTLRPSDFRPVLQHPKDILVGELAQFLIMPSLAWLTFESITEDAVLEVFSKDRKPKMGHSLKYSVEYGLKACLPHYGKSVERIIAYLPSIPNMRKNIQYLTEQELTAIRHTLEHDSTISLQDKAIITLAMYTGLRGCDISALTLDSFDWEHDLIKITQAKTGQPLTLPLRAVVGNAVFDYLLKERPRSPEPYVFLTVQVPYRRLHTSNLDAICSKVMCKAGIRQGENERKSLHLFRHNVATALLQGGVQQPVISATLGHASPDSLDRYLSAEFKRLKECSLSIEYFPVGKGVFDV